MSVIEDLSLMNDKRARGFFNSFDVVLSDCDGVIWYMEKPIPGAIQTLNRLQEVGKGLHLVTNNSTISNDRYLEKLGQNQLVVKSEQIITTAKVICWYLKKIQFKGEAFVIASPAFRQTLIDAGFTLSPENPKIVEGDAFATIRAVEDKPSVKAIIVDFCIFLDWPKLALAISCLKRNDVLYLCGTQDEWIVYGVGKKILGSGPLIEVITKKSGRTPIQCAKPSEVLKNYVFEICKIQDPKRCLFIGDTMDYDMKFATMCGFQKLLVGTGLDNIKDTEVNEENRPDYYIPRLELLHPIIDSLQNSSANENNSFATTQLDYLQ